MNIIAKQPAKKGVYPLSSACWAGLPCAFCENFVDNVYIMLFL